MKSRATLIALSTILAVAAGAPAWAQGSLEKDDNGPRLQSPGQAAPAPMPAPGTAAPGGTVGKGGAAPKADDSSKRLPNAPNAQTGGRPNNPVPGPTDRSGNVPSENR